MEPATTTVTYYLLVSFYMYFIGANIFDQINFRRHVNETEREFNNVTNILCRIETKLSEIESNKKN